MRGILGSPVFGTQGIQGIKRSFTIYPNHHFKGEEIVNGIRHTVDRDLHSYDRLVQAYLFKRWIKKSEIRKNQKMMNFSQRSSLKKQK